MSDTNPRVLLWLRAVKLTEKDIDRVDPNEVRRVVLDGEEVMWTVAFITWSSRMYREWAASVGYTHGNKHFEAHDIAFMNGKTMADHIAWVEEQIK